MPPKESDIQKAIMEYLSARGIWHYRSFNAPLMVGKGKFARTLNPGLPDITGCLPCGRILQIEVKRSKSAPKTKYQQAWISQVSLNNGVAFFAWSVDQVAERLGDCSHSCKRLRCPLVLLKK